MLNFFEGVPFFTYIFYLYFSLILTFAGLIIFTPNSVASVLYLVLVFIFTSFSFVLLGAAICYEPVQPASEPASQPASQPARPAS